MFSWLEELTRSTEGNIAARESEITQLFNGTPSIRDTYPDLAVVVDALEK